VSLPPWILIDPLLTDWLREDLGRGDRTTQALFPNPSQSPMGEAEFVLKQPGVVAGLAIALRVFQVLDSAVTGEILITEGEAIPSGMVVARVHGPMAMLLMGERVALNLLMRLSGIATLTRQYVATLEGGAAQLVDTRKTTPGLRILEKYAVQVGGAVNHRFGLDDALMLKDNHLAAAGGVAKAIALARAQMPYPLTLEVETATLEQVEEAIAHGADIIMLDNMGIETMTQAVAMIRAAAVPIKIEASGNITLATLRSVAQTGVDFISTSAPITQASWLDISLRIGKG
jgi:nicotinate-nucleotide pyrophosphorylase (carboxylating)